MKNIAVFVSGSGTDMQSIIDSIKKGEINGKVVLVIASKNGIYAIERAVKEGIPYKVFDKSKFDSLDNMDNEILKVLKEYNVDLIVLAGYLNILTKDLVKTYDKKIINIHPSLIPKHCGKGFYGLKVHKSVIESGDKISGATVHYVDENTDTGEIIMQETIPVYDDDTPESLQNRVLDLEHILLPKAVKKLCE